MYTLRRAERLRQSLVTTASGKTNEQIFFRVLQLILGYEMIFFINVKKLNTFSNRQMQPIGSDKHSCYLKEIHNTVEGRKICCMLYFDNKKTRNMNIIKNTKQDL